MDDFDKLFWAARIGHAKFPFLLLVFEWSDKRQHIGMYQRDIPGLRRAFVEQKQLHTRGRPTCQSST